MDVLSVKELKVQVEIGPPYQEAFLNALKGDARKGVQNLYKACLRQLDALESARLKQQAMLAFEQEAWDNGFTRVAGVDEAGRGPLAGPVVAAAVVLVEPVLGLDDSKKLRQQQREDLFDLLQNQDHCIGVGLVEAAEIDRIGIQQANYQAMFKAIQQVVPMPDFALIDGFAVPGLPCPQKRIVKGDQKSQSIAAASIVAKVIRDRMMTALDREYPGYGFGKHKGYGTQQHLMALSELGPCPAHRHSFAPIAQPKESDLLF